MIYERAFEQKERKEAKKRTTKNIYIEELLAHVNNLIDVKDLIGALIYQSKIVQLSCHTETVDTQTWFAQHPIYYFNNHA